MLVIAAVRLELLRLGWASTASRVAFAGSLVLLVAGLAVTLVWGPGGQRLAGVGLLGLGLWLLRYDVARRTVRSSGVPRFMAIAALAGYFWLLRAGVLWVALGSSAGGGAYDAEVCAALVGFVILMVFAHAPVTADAHREGQVQETEMGVEAAAENERQSQDGSGVMSQAKPAWPGWGRLEAESRCWFSR